jgi:Uma2 family endonuclease
MSSVRQFVLDAPILLDDVILPESDGQPLAETDVHRDEMVDLIEALKEWFRTEAEVYVSGNLLLYYDPYDLNEKVAPDVFVVFGVPKHRRRYYKIWEEGKAPDVVVEVTSRSTRDEDMQFKRRLYADLRVAEYVMCDPTGDYLSPRLQGYRLEEEEYVPVIAAGGRLWSEVLQMEWRLEGDRLRLYDPETETYLLSPAEQAEARRAAEARAEAEAARAEAEARSRAEAETQVAALQAEIERLRQMLGATG